MARRAAISRPTSARTGYRRRVDMDVHLLDETIDAQKEKSCQLACLVPPAQISHVEEIASKYEKMPAKSTFFYPKLLSGLVFNPLE